MPMSDSEIKEVALRQAYQEFVHSYRPPRSNEDASIEKGIMVLGALSAQHHKVPCHFLINAPYHAMAEGSASVLMDRILSRATQLEELMRQARDGIPPAEPDIETETFRLEVDVKVSAPSVHLLPLHKEQIAVALTFDTELQVVIEDVTLVNISPALPF